MDTGLIARASDRAQKEKDKSEWSEGKRGEPQSFFRDLGAEQDKEKGKKSLSLSLGWGSSQRRGLVGKKRESER